MHRRLIGFILMSDSGLLVLLCHLVIAAEKGGVVRQRAFRVPRDSVPGIEDEQAHPCNRIFSMRV